MLFSAAAYCDKVIAPFLIGYNITTPIISKYDTSKLEPADFGLSLSIYKIKYSGYLIYLNPGLTSGFEVNRYTGRLYLGINYLLVGYINDKIKYIPILSGLTLKALFEVSKYNRNTFNTGTDIGFWINLGIIGQITISERYTIGNNLSTRIEYGHRFPIFGEPKRKS
jgi:hypothetical protein